VMIALRPYENASKLRPPEIEALALATLTVVPQLWPTLPRSDDGSTCAAESGLQRVLRRVATEGSRTKARVSFHSFPHSPIDGSQGEARTLLGLRGTVHLLKHFVAASLRQCRSRRYQGVCELEDRVLEEIGLTRDQVRFDNYEPVWWH
jgi:hypothetical protein